jgi:hypothetical protein
MDLSGDREFLEAFESCRLAPEHFHHRDHLRLAWIYLQLDASTAPVRIGESIRRYAVYHGKSDKYHETMTVAWLRLLADAACRQRAGNIEELLRTSPELLDQNTLHQYYSPELLASQTARIEFVIPHRKPLPADTPPPR